MAGSEVQPTKAANPHKDAHTTAQSSPVPQHNTHTSTTSRKTTRSSQVKEPPTSAPSSSPSSSNTLPSVDSQPSRSTSLRPTASAVHLSATQTDGATSGPSGLSDGSKKAIIAAATLVGTLILATLLYLIWRKRRGAKFSGFVCCGDGSDTITLATSPGGRITALPIYRENRYSVRSSRIGSKLSLGKYRRERFDRDHPWEQNTWKTQNPPTPTSERHPLARVMNAPPSPPLKQLGMTRVYSSQTMENRMAKNTSEDTTKSGAVIAVQAAEAELSPTESVFGLPPQTRKSPHKARWSWTNADAPSTPRLAAPSIGKSSVSSLPRFRRVASWVRVQASRQGIPTEAPPLPSSPGSSMPILKNKASKPNLFPGPPQRKLSKNKRPDSSSNALRPSLDNPRLSPPAPVKLNHKRPPAPLDAEDNLFVSYS